MSTGTSVVVPKDISIYRSVAGKSFLMEIDGERFPFAIARDSLSIHVGGPGQPDTVTMTLLADHVTYNYLVGQEGKP